MATWRDRLLPAKFRGVEFDVLVTDAQLGRRAALHEYPGRDKPWVEDLGRKARVVTLDAVLVGADCLERRDSLLKVLEEPGAGKLEHPTLGEMQATLTDCRLAESTAEGRMVRFGLVFVEAGELTWPRAAASTPNQVAGKCEAALAAAKSAFAGGLKIGGLPDFIAGSATSVLGGLASQVRAVAGTVQAALAPLAELQRQVDAFNADLITLVYEPAKLGNGVVDMVQQLVRGVAQTPFDALAMTKTMWRFGTLQVDLGGASAKRAIELTNQVEMARLVRTTAVAEAARAASTLAFDSYEDAASLRDDITDAMDELLLAIADDDAFDTLRALRAAAVADITARGADLTRLSRHTPLGTLPVLVLAQQLYADATQADDVLARNARLVPHPLFVRGGVDLEVRANG